MPIRTVASGVASRLADFGSRRIDRGLARLAEAEPVPDGHARALMESAGVTLEDVVKTRPDGRCIYLVRQPDGMPAVLKVNTALIAATSALGNQRLAEMAETSGARFFPRVRAATAEYTVEEFIDGIPLRRWLETEFRMGPVEDFLLDLRAWGRDRGPWLGGAHLLPGEIRSIVLHYVSKCIGQGSYSPTAQRFSAIYALLRQRADLERDLRWLLREAETIALPRGMMCGDLSNVNLIVDPARDRLFVIDYEFMGPGHVGFDCAYLLTSLDKIPTCPRATREIAAFVQSEDFAGSAAHARFFRVLNGLLTRIGQSVYGRSARVEDAPRPPRPAASARAARSPGLS